MEKKFMKPIIPKVSMQVWNNLYAAANRFNALKPWEILDDTDLIGVREPSTGDTGYGVYMGSGGTIFGFCLYRGAEGFDIYRRIVEGVVDPERHDVFAMQNCLKLELGSRTDLMPEDLSIIRQLGLSFKGKHGWPEFRAMSSGYAPWFLAEAEARFLTLGLNAACVHHNRVMNREINDSLRESECIVYIPVADSQTEFTSQWEPLPVVHQPPVSPAVLNLARLSSLRTKKLNHDTPWEADIFSLPSVILDRERPYFMRVAAVCQQSSGLVFAAETFPPEAQGTQSLADVMCTSIERSGCLPDTIYVKSKDMADGLKPLAKALGFTIRKRAELDAVVNLKETMMERFVYGGRGRR